MKFVFAAMALTLGMASAAQAYDADIEAIIDGQKPGKAMARQSVSTLMAGAEAWCYDEMRGACSWREVYLDVRQDGVTFELANYYALDIDYAFTDQGVFRGNKICQSGFNWLPSLRASYRTDGRMMGGRDLQDFRLAMTEARPRIDSYSDCFDYLYVSSDAAKDTVTLLQRQYDNEGYYPAGDVEVTLHFDKESAAALKLRED